MYQVLERVVQESPDALFLVRENITFKQALDLIKARAATLFKESVKFGDVVGLLSHNIPQFPLTLFAVWYLGATVLLLDTNLTPFEYENMTKTVGCKFVCAEKSFFFNTKNLIKPMLVIFLYIHFQPPKLNCKCIRKYRNFLVAFSYIHSVTKKCVLPLLHCLV